MSSPAGDTRPRVTMYGTGWCPYCAAARDLLRQKGVELEEIDLTRQPGRRPEMEARSGRSSVPQIFIGDEHIGGYDDISALERRGQLDERLGLKK